MFVMSYIFAGKEMKVLLVCNMKPMYLTRDKEILPLWDLFFSCSTHKLRESQQGNYNTNHKKIEFKDP